MVCERPTQGSLCWFKQEYFSPCFRLYTLVSSYLQTNSTKANYVANNLPNFLPFRDRRRKIASNCTPERSGPRSCKRFFLKNGPSSAYFSLIFVLSNTHYNSYNKYMWKMLCPSSIRCWDSNPRPSEYESPFITNRLVNVGPHYLP